MIKGLEGSRGVLWGALFSLVLVLTLGAGTAVDYDRAFKIAAAGTKLELGATLLQLERISENVTLSDPNLAMAANLNTGVAIVATMTYSVDGSWSTINGYLSDGGGGDVTAEPGFIAFTATTHDIAADTGAVQEAVYVFSTDSSGTITVTQGTVVDGSGNAAYPTTPAGETCFGAVRIAVAAGSTDFNATSDDLDAGHLTVTYFDHRVNPADSKLE